MTALIMVKSKFWNVNFKMMLIAGGISIGASVLFLCMIFLGIWIFHISEMNWNLMFITSGCFGCAAFLMQLLMLDPKYWIYIKIFIPESNAYFACVSDSDVKICSIYLHTTESYGYTCRKKQFKVLVKEITERVAKDSLSDILKWWISIGAKSDKEILERWKTRLENGEHIDELDI